MRYVGYEQMKGLRTLPGVRQRRPAGLALLVLMFVSLALLALNRMENSYVRDVRWKITEWMTPVLSAAIVPLEPLRRAGHNAAEMVDLVGELERLRNENQQLKGWQWRASELERKLADLSASSNTARDSKIDFVTARVIAHSSGAFVRSAMINAGREQGIKTGYPVMGGDGLVGRIDDTGPNAARVQLLTDFNSRVPVLIGRSAIRAILAGDNGPSPKLIYVGSDTEVKPGDDVSASGVGGIFPRGLRIGTVADIGQPMRVRLNGNFDALEYLSVLFYESPAIELLDGDGAVKGAAVSKKSPAAAVPQ